MHNANERESGQPPPAARRLETPDHTPPVGAHVAADEGKSWSQVVLLMGVVTAVLAVLAIDAVAPLGVATGILYIPVVLLSLWLRQYRLTIAIALVTTGLTVLGFFLSPTESASQWMGIANRSLAITAVWVTTGLGYVVIRGGKLLRDREQRLRAVLDTAVDVIITIDRNGIILHANPAIARVFGYQPEEVIGRNVNVLMPAPYREEHDDYLAHYLRTGEARIIGIGREVAARRKDGSTFPIDLAVSEMDHVQMFTGMIRDISERKALQKQVLEIAADEQRRIGQDLHDGIGQELTGIGLVAGGLVEAFSSPETAQLLEQAGLSKLQNAAVKISTGIGRTLGQVRALSRGMVPVEVDSEGLMAALSQLATSIRELHDVSCTFQCDEPVQLTDNFTATHLYRVAQEATTNAIKHANAQHLKIVLTESARRLIIEVIDDGVGMHNPGKGMGLQIMRYRAELIGATLNISSTETTGTHVVCTLPHGISP